MLYHSISGYWVK